MDVELLRPGNVPISPNTVLWFEFLLYPNLLEEHLQKPYPGKQFYCSSFNVLTTVPFFFSVILNVSSILIFIVIRSITNGSVDQILNIVG